jgi:hypothetical protein
MPGWSHVSPSTVGRPLHADWIRAWRSRMWQHIQNPHRFLERARPVVPLYAAAQALWQVGTWVVCVDEQTSIQVREAEQAPRPPQRNCLLCQSPRSHRRGALHLLAGLSVADGQVMGQCATRQRFVDLQAFLEQVLVPQARRRGVQRVALVLENGPPHAPKQVERWLQAQTQAQQWGLTFQVYWLPTNARRLSGSVGNLVESCCNASSSSPIISPVRRILSKHCWRSSLMGIGRLNRSTGPTPSSNSNRNSQ